MKEEVPKYSCGTDDITFCMSKCEEEKCFRHPSNIIHPELPHSVSLLKGSEICQMTKLHPKQCVYGVFETFQSNERLVCLCKSLEGAKEVETEKKDFYTKCRIEISIEIKPQYIF